LLTSSLVFQSALVRGFGIIKHQPIARPSRCAPFALASKQMTVLDKGNSIQIITEKVLTEAQKKNPLIIAIDGGSGAGKSTIALQLAKQLNAVIIPLDDFYAADISNEKWHQFTVKEKLSEVFHWERLMTTAINPLLN
jgi:hypothetical protein